MGTGDTALVDNWLQAHKPRRYSRGDSASPDALRAFLKDHGYDLGFTGWRGGQRAIIRRPGARGRPPTMDMRDLLFFVDDLRIAEGLEPIMSAAEHRRRDEEELRRLKKQAA